MIVGSASASCPVCGADRCGCGPETTTVPVDQRIKETTMPGPVKAYDVEVNGIPTRLKLTEDEARRRGLTADKPPTKKRTARNKAVPSPEPPAPERPAGNASTETWAAYAKAVGVDVPEDAGRNDIIAVVDDA